jgi:hypothetical protein
MRGFVKDKGKKYEAICRENERAAGQSVFDLDFHHGGSGLGSGVHALCVEFFSLLD